jgi:hypothetical protein
MGIQINGQTDTVTAIDGSINIGGNVTVPGVLTYDDVTNIDSVGVITARSGIRVTGGVVDIGTETSGRKTLTLNSSDNGSAVVFRADAATRARIEVPDGQTDLIFGVETAVTPSERLRITSGGLVGIGSDDPQAPLNVLNNNANTPTVWIRNVSGGGDSPALRVQGGANNNNAVGTFEVRDYDGNVDFKVGGTGNIGIGTDDPGSNKLQIQGDTLSVGNILIDGKEVYYTNVYSVNGWGNDGLWHTVCPHTLSNNSMYLVAIVWDWGGSVGQPYYLVSQTLYSTVNSTNGTSSENELTPLCSTHTGGTSARINVRTLAQSGGGTSALQVNLSGFNSGANSKLTVKCWRIMSNTRSGAT